MAINDKEEKQPLEHPEELEELPDMPVFLRDAPPTRGKMNMIKWGLMHDTSEKDLEDQGFNPKSIRMAAFELEKDNYRKRPAKSRTKEVSTNAGGGGTTTVATRSRGSFPVPIKGAPPEFLIDQISLPMDGAGAKSFEQGMKFGASMLVLGVRVAQELGNMGLQQAQPIINMANAMRQGEAEAAKGAAAEAAAMAAEQVGGNLLPIISSLQKEKTAAGDPVKQMMVRTMEPIMQKMMGMVMPGMGGEVGGLPSGWTRKTRDE